MIIEIFKFLHIRELFTCENRMCHRFRFLIDNFSILYRDFDIHFALNFCKKYLVKVLNHSSSFGRFVINPRSTVADVDLSFAKYFKSAPNLYWVELNDCQISTLCFIEQIPYLQILFMRKGPSSQFKLLYILIIPLL